MCGIVGYVGKKSVVPVIIDGLRRLEYRGYDSAGIAVAGNGDGLQVRGNTYLSDCVEATLLAMQALPGETYNVGGGETASVGAD